MAGLLDFIKTPRSDNPNRKASLAGRSQIYNLLDNIIGFNDDRVTPGEALGAGMRNDPMGLLGSMAQGVEGDLSNLMFEGGAMQRPEDVLGYAAAPMAPGAAGLMKNTPNVTNAIRAYQGTPHNFAAERLVRMPDGSTQYVVGKPDILPDIPSGAELVQDYPLGRMRMDKMGTGEGAQAYGHGLYYAENEGIARGYRDALSRGIDDTGVSLRLDGRQVSEPTSDQIRVARFGVDSTLGGVQRQIDAAQRKLETASRLDELDLGISDYDMLKFEIDGLTRRAQEIQGLAGRVEMAPAGSMYEVNINANPEDFLDWDAPLSAQPRVAQRLGLSTRTADEINEEATRLMVQGNEKAGVAGGWMDDPELSARIDALNDEIDRVTPDTTGESIYRSVGQGGVADLISQLGGGSPQMRAQELRDAGIPGIRYLDAGSRGAGDGTRNFVVFDENLINIVRKYGIAGAATMLGISALDVEQAMAQGSPQRQGLLAQGAR